MGCVSTCLGSHERSSEARNGDSAEGVVPLLFTCADTSLRYIDQVQAKFPWYKRINSMLCRSPLVDRSSVANSGTEVDLSILDRGLSVRSILVMPYKYGVHYLVVASTVEH